MIDLNLMTDEQKNAAMDNSKYKRIISFAGSGKTAVAYAIIKNNPTKRILYLSFSNKLVQSASKELRGVKNVDVFTPHSFALRNLGADMSGKLLEGTTYKYNVMCKEFDLTSGVNKNLYMQIFRIMQRFEKVKDKKVFRESDFDGFSPKEREFIENKTLEILKIRSTSGNGFKISHDFYLKLFYLVGRKFLNYDIVILDEYQDANELIGAVVEEMFPNSQIVLIGDPYQKIYGFRDFDKSVKVFNLPYKDMYLTKSFRIGNTNALITSKVLNSFLGERNVVVGGNPNQMVYSSNNKDSYHLMCRTRAGVVEYAVSEMLKGKTIGFLKPLKEYRLDSLVDLYHLYSGRYDRVIDKTVCQGHYDFDSLRNDAQLLKDKETLSAINIVMKNGSNIIDIVKDIKYYVVTDPQVTLMTIHNSKGLEFPVVVLGDDLFDLNSEIKEDFNYEEINLIYVADTRATLDLVVNSKQEQYLSGRGIRFDSRDYGVSKIDIFNNY